ncbi:hypothetical protein C5167_012078 [Papaver somniferum]|uniref:Uncharacterized protein n=1 Tax=Papaver somniferum TaxID=3469 RepID=A0A4Y7IZN6_PAPSO|nr:hypothetical protein C5167_012078 [Papaver somniferum]
MRLEQISHNKDLRIETCVEAVDLVLPISVAVSVIQFYNIALQHVRDLYLELRKKYRDLHMRCKVCNSVDLFSEEYIS